MLITTKPPFHPWSGGLFFQATKWSAETLFLVFRLPTAQSIRYNAAGEKTVAGTNLCCMPRKFVTKSPQFHLR
jgi:hypothetical protein